MDGLYYYYYDYYDYYIITIALTQGHPEQGVAPRGFNQVRGRSVSIRIYFRSKYVVLKSNQMRRVLGAKSCSGRSGLLY